ncbi:tRNA glutamyl-Q(34) synthetase GluQRS [Suttonella ornithocola]|uniref:Glutamyl-Q tRNA(Asp) synthetase n=1 Tax=Suttonella ornithocola TaxID=279832 RepID=A0A380MSE3_9GAMM|nr:tRNA glutamyl-Q(34) synthetase GluQRS [Suttonella ornithocola]SUO95549.1 Glutamyl-Q tRNA(Asp) synthetase [Suttonella ornithocola]
MHTQISSTYRGRFAPTPSGPLHFGSLVAALGSYLDAKSHKGQWIIRIEDADRVRSHQQYAETIIKTMTIHGLVSDEPIVYQSQRLAYYCQALHQLSHQLYACKCSRRDWHSLAKNGVLGKIYPGICRHSSVNNLHPSDTAIRLKLPDKTIVFNDRLYGQQKYHLTKEIGDPILRRRDGDIAYVLAVVVDDYLQKISHIVRGADLLASTCLQQYLQKQLGYPLPTTLHLPLVFTETGDKLSKQNHAPAINDSTPSENLLFALKFLGQNTDGLSPNSSIETLLHTAIKRWDINKIPH